MISFPIIYWNWSKLILLKVQKWVTFLHLKKDKFYKIRNEFVVFFYIFMVFLKNDFLLLWINIVLQKLVLYLVRFKLSTALCIVHSRPGFTHETSQALDSGKAKDGSATRSCAAPASSLKSMEIWSGRFEAIPWTKGWCPVVRRTPVPPKKAGPEA